MQITTHDHWQGSLNVGILEGYVRFILMCGLCDLPLADHTLNTTNDDLALCKRLDFDYYDLGDEFFSTDPVEDFDYYSYPANPRVVIPYTNFSYNPGGMFDAEEDPSDFDPDSSVATHAAEFDELHSYYQAEMAKVDALDRWYDNEPDYCTHATARWNNTRVVHPYAQPRTFVQVGDRMLTESDAPLATERKRDETPINSIHGFTSEVLVDPDLTEKHQQRIVNAYWGNDRKFHIGGITISHHPVTNQIIARCSHSDCYDNVTKDQRFFPYTGDYSRDSLMDFAFRCFRHGNNHAANWILAREDFTFIHATNCDESEHHIAYKNASVRLKDWATGTFTVTTRPVPVATACNSHKPLVVIADLDHNDKHACYRFLKLHQKFCHDSKCRCTHYESLLWDELFGSSLTNSPKEYAHA